MPDSLDPHSNRRKWLAFGALVALVQLSFIGAYALLVLGLSFAPNTSRHVSLALAIILGLLGSLVISRLPLSTTPGLPAGPHLHDRRLALASFGGAIAPLPFLSVLLRDGF